MNDNENLDNISDDKSKFDQLPEEVKTQMIQLNLTIDKMIADTAANMGIQIPDVQKLYTKYSLLVDNKEEMNLIKYTTLLEMNLKHQLMIHILAQSAQKENKQIDLDEDITSTDD